MAVKGSIMRADVLYQFNEAYVPYAGVSITSLLENNQDIDEIKIYVLDDNVSEASRDMLRLTVERYARQIEFIDAAEIIDTMKKLGIPKYRGSYTTNLKLFLPMVIDYNIQRLLYIDSDTVVNGSIRPLFEMNMDSYPVAMSYDSLGKKHKQLIGLSNEDGYYNAGVILFNLDEWKKQMCTERIVEHVKNVRAHYMSPDQDLINIVLNGQIKTIEPEYNLQPIHLVYKYGIYKLFFGQKNYYDRKSMEHAVKSPVILHFFRFIGQFPWDKDSLHPDTEIFDRYMSIYDWRNYEKTPAVQSGTVFKIERWMYRHLPQFVFLIIFKVNYEIFIKKAEKRSKLQHELNEM